MAKINNLAELNKFREKGLIKVLPAQPMITVGLGTCGIGNGAQAIFDGFAELIKTEKLKIILKPVGCFGYCAAEPLVGLYLPGKPLLIYQDVGLSDISRICQGAKTGKIYQEKILCKIENWDHLTGIAHYGAGYTEFKSWDQIPFYQGQKKIILRDCGLINPGDIEEYIAVGGYQALAKVLADRDPELALNEIKKSHLRGRGGAGFPTALKWEIMKNSPGDQKYIVCNADEGDPGAYMNRNELESDPHMLIEGMAIGAYVMGAATGVIYVRAEYPLAVKRVKEAIEQAREYSLLGKSILNSNFNFDINIVEGAGAFVCGEETALIASIEGRTGRPNVRPPFPAQQGLYGKPTNINNVETWCNVPVIITRGGEWFAKIGTSQSTGTKVFSLVGKIKNTGLVEMPLGTKLHDIIYGNGGGTGKIKKVKAVQTGGPSGGCIPAELFNTSVDYESLAALGAIMGSGGMVVMDDDNCMVDVARYFLEFTTAESCGKCVPCREGLTQLLALVKSIATGQGTLANLNKLQLLSRVIKDSALCGLGQTGPNPVLTTMKYFYDEYAEHIKNKYCRAGVCQELFIAPCENSCPLHMNIPGYLELYKEGRLEEAFELILRDNPLPATLGRICHFHCKMRCRREDLDQSVRQGEVHRLIADTIYENKKEQPIYEKLLIEKLPRTRKKIAIIGAGPAGLTAAYYLVRLGHEVVVYDRTDEPGGVLRWGIPEYRLPKKVLRKELAFLKKLGVRFIFFKELGQNLKLKELTVHYDKVVLAIGAQKEMALGVPGEEAAGVIQGIKFLNRVAAGQKVILGKKVIVIGGGNVAIDAARTALRLGAEVTVVYRRDREAMPANRYELESAEKEGIKFEFYASPKQFIVGERGKVSAVELQIMEPGDWDQSGRRKPVPIPELKKRFADTFILAIGEKIKVEPFAETSVKLNKNGFPEIDIRNFQTNDPRIHAIGDLVLGPATAAEAMGQGRQLAQQLDLELVPIGKKEQPRFAKLFNAPNYENKIPIEPQGNKGSTIEELKIAERIKDFQEVSLGLTSKQAYNECLRCLRCDVKETGRGKK